jgi:hypothetical protein
MKRTRGLGLVLLDMEPLILECVNEHELQWGDVLNLIYGYLEIHCPDSREDYVDGSRTQFYYGPELKRKRKGK